MNQRRTLGQRGFGAIEIIGIVLLVVIVSGLGWYVWSKKDTGSDSQNSFVATTKKTEKPKNTAKPYIVPSGYYVYENKEYGFKFAYPKEYGKTFKKNTTYGGAPITSVYPGAISFYESEKSPENVLPGTQGPISFVSYSSADQPVLARKYGPNVKISGKEVVVVKASSSDLTKNKPGDVYKDFNKESVTPKQTNGLSVFVLKDGDEGYYNDHFLFVINGKLYQLNVPGFNTGTYGPVDAKPNDRTKYNELYNNILNSISAL